jgi:micrococcal nuclease
MLYTYRAVVDRVVDGDTVDCTIDLGFDIHIKQRVRLYGIDAPETRTKDLEEKKQGTKSKRWLQEQVEGKAVMLESEKFNRGKYGRVIGTIHIGSEEPPSIVNINKLMLELGLAEPYKS